MNKLKRTLALTLVLCMLCSFFPVSAFAAGNGAPVISGTSDAPFKKSTGGSNSFRIPALVTMSDGTLVAAADARWNTTYDGGGLDTMVAVSKDNGATWEHSFANYLGDNGNEYNGSSSTAFIDPALAVTSKDTIYMLVDLYPYGIALNGNVAAYPNTDTGFNDDGYLKLDYNSAGTYGYYLKDGKIYANGAADPLGGYTVDAYFNVTNENVTPATTTNLFFADSTIFKVARTGFLYLTKSTDGGKNWSAPQLLNLKNGTERVCLVGPGRGLVTKNGTIVFPVYSFPGDPTDPEAYTEQRMGFIYSTNGTDWQRSANLDYQWASESAVVELNDGTLRFFFRNGSKAVMYVDYNMTAKTWGTPVNTGVASNSNCQVSAISLNQTVDGKQVILVSCPQGATAASDNDSSASARLNGKIHLFTVGENNALTKVSTVAVPSVHGTNSFMYSCLTAQKDASGNETGNISILYEDQESAWGTGENCYYQMSFKTFDVEESFGVTLEGAVTRETVDVTLKVGETVTKTIKGVALNGSNTDAVADVTWTGTESPTTVTIIGKGVGNTKVEVGNTIYNITVSYDVANVVNVKLEVGESKSYTDESGNYADDENNIPPTAAIAEMTVTPVVGITETTVSTTKATAIEDGATYILRVYNTEYALSSNSGKTDWGTQTRAFERNTLTANEDHFWTLSAVGGGYQITNSEGMYLVLGNLDNQAKLDDQDPDTFTLTYTDTGWTIGNTYGRYINALGGLTTYYSAGGWTGDGTRFDLYKVDKATEATTEITFTGVAPGSTTAVVGNTQYNITVTKASTVKDTITTDGQTSEAYVLDTDGVINTDTTYLIVNTGADGTGYAITNNGGTIADSTEVTISNGVIDVEDDSKIAWTFSASVSGKITNNGYYLLPWSGYLYTNKSYSSYTINFADAGSGAYKVYYYYSNYYYFYPTYSNNHWTGLNTTALNSVGNVYLYAKTEVQGWSVDAAKQQLRYNAIIGSVDPKDAYTDVSWSAYDTARKDALTKLRTVTSTSYPSEAAAQAALNELIAAMDELEAKYGALAASRTINIHYTYNGTVIETENIKVAETASTLILNDTIVVNETAYSVTDPIIKLTVDSTVYVPVELIGKLGGGFVGSKDIEAGTHQGLTQICDLVDDTTGTPKKITEMTLTTGISYNLDLKTNLEDGYTVEWDTGNGTVATVDADGIVVAVGAGTTNITATVRDAAGNIVEINSIPVTVFPSATTKRKSAVYIENIDNTTVYCVVNADTSATAFEVIEGELICGYFDIPVSDGTSTTAFSFFGDPDEAHALVAMTSTNSFGDYYLLHEDGSSDPGIGTEYYRLPDGTPGAGYWQAIGLTDNVNDGKADWTKIEAMIKWAIGKGCDGGMGFTRRLQEGDIGTNLTFISDPMPKIEKEIDGVLPTSRKQADYRSYVENMVAAVHELVYFKITVTLEAPTQWRPYEANTDSYYVTENGVTYAVDADGNKFSAITYSSAFVTDTILPGAYLYNQKLDQEDGNWDGEIPADQRSQEDNITDQLNAGWTADEIANGKRVLTYYLVYEIQESDIPKFYIDNIAYLNYDYKSHYSTGAQKGAADAEARISVVGSAIDNVVIDFGQPVTYTGLENIHLKGVYVDGDNDVEGVTASKGRAKYGDVSVKRTHRTDENGNKLYDDKNYPLYDYTVTYIPHGILHETDAVVLYGIGDEGHEKIINGFLVYPASTVYYEEGFMLEHNISWPETGSMMATTEQTFELLGKSQFNSSGLLTHYISDKKHAYGFDPIYDGNEDNGEVTKSSISSNTVGASTEFTFTGTGFEIFADCTEESGHVSVSVHNANGNLVKMLMVNTVVKGGSTDATIGQTGDMNSLPIVSIKDLEHGTYTVTLTKIMKDGKTVTIDGVRITNTLSDSTAYTVDLEDNPEFYQLRDSVLNAIGIFPETSEDYIDPSMLKNKSNEEIEELLRSVVDVVDFEKTASQVYNSMLVDSDSEAPSAVITDTSVIYGQNFEIQDLLDNGPKNEIYLWRNQTLTFKVSTQRVMQVGLKAPTGETTYTITCTGKDNKTVTMGASTDMFYYVVDAPVTDVTEYTISITNTGSSVLAITDLKVCDDPNAALVPLTEEDVRQILIDAGYTDGIPETPEKPAVPFVDVAADSFYYDAVAWAVSENITTGISDTHFGPLVFCNRAQAVTFLWRAAGSPEPTIAEHQFVDVPAGSFYEKAVLWALENGITTGTDSSHFSPMLSCNRATVVTFLYRAFQEPAVGSSENPFSDVPADAWFTAPILWAVEQEITTGMGDGTFGVIGACNRAQIVTFLYRAYN